MALEPTTDPAKRTGLQPSTSVAISAAPRSKIDGGPVGGAVTATLSGEGAVTPSGTKVPADASFTYTAASTAGKAGKVALEARSRRGVAKAELNFDTAEDSWIGTASFRDDILSATAQITWMFVSSENNVSMYKSTGTGTVAYDDGTCSYPTTGTVADGAGILFVDFNTTPPTFHGAGTIGNPDCHRHLQVQRRRWRRTSNRWRCPSSAGPRGRKAWKPRARQWSAPTRP